jgi:hypothetical protein
VDSETQNDPRRNAAEAGSAHGHDDAGPQTREFGVGRRARITAIRAADDLRAHGIAAAALFKPSMGGWIVQIYPGGIRQRGRPPTSASGTGPGYRSGC